MRDVLHFKQKNVILGLGTILDPKPAFLIKLNADPSVQTLYAFVTGWIEISTMASFMELLNLHLQLSTKRQCDWYTVSFRPFKLSFSDITGVFAAS